MKKTEIMKTIKHIGIIAALIIFTLSTTNLQAQSKKEQEDQKAAQEAELKARKEMLEQQHAEMKEREIEFREQQVHAEEMARESARASSRASAGARVIYRSPDDSDYSYFISSYDEGNQSQITLRNTFKGGSDTSKGEFEVDETTKNFRLMIRGKVKSGEIRIRLLYPDGKVFKDQTINSSAEITLTQSIRIKEESENRYFGSWTYEVTNKEAMGDYSMSISTN